MPINNGNLSAIEYLLGQLFVYVTDNENDPQGWLERNAHDIKEKLIERDTFSEAEKTAAYGTVIRVLETASKHFDAAGRGPMIDLRSEDAPPDA